MEDIKNAILAMRDVKPSTLNLYMRNLRKLKDNIPSKKGIDFLKKREIVMDYLSNLKRATQMTYLIAIRMALLAMNKNGKLDNLLEFYYDEFLKRKKETDEQRGKNEKTEKQEANWATMEELREVMNDYGKKIKNSKLANKDELTKKEMDLMQKWIVANLYLHDSNPPVRLNYSPMFVISEKDYEDGADKSKNYLVIKSRNNKYFVFNNYKTDDTYGERKIKVGSKLNSALNMWLKHNKSGSLLLNKEGKPMSSNHLSKYIQSVFSPTGKNIGASMLRHIYISEKFEPKSKEKKEIADKMLHSVSEQGIYAKED
jgi:site-specific recombinase XerD